ncbi:MAG: hypothetical protein D6776_11900 [Planctomycetota bacterium]|nr:MAG: hypothetical protein D6776_11900 [Planctomycetota bacterium]
MSWMHDGWHMAWMGLARVLGIAFLIAIGWWLGRASASSAAPPPAEHESPEQILKRRYARGEIDRQEYERMLEEIRRG